MSRKACLLTTDDVPKYIREIVKRLHPVKMEYTDENGNWWGYIFRLDAKWKCGYESQLSSDAEKLVEWCRSWFAYAKVIKFAWWFNEVETSTEHEQKGTHWHQRKALREGFRNHVYLVISDPVAYRLEKDSFFREEKSYVG